MSATGLAEPAETKSAFSFVETSVSREVFKIVDLAIGTASNAYIAGVPGVGKTCGLRACAAARDEVTYLRLTQPATRSAKALMAAICGALGIYDDGPPREIEQRILKTECAAAVILDEGQYLDEERMDLLVHLSATDGGRLVFIVCGNPRVKVTAGTNSGKFAGIARRFTLQRLIEGITQADADAITNSFGVEGMDAYRIMRAVGARHHADGVANVLKLARLAAGSATIKATHIQEVIELVPQFRPAPAKR
jgi:DNA transposition AAA+ family ATPase